jgi:hypothetical protein
MPDETPELRAARAAARVRRELMADDPATPHVPEDEPAAPERPGIEPPPPGGLTEADRAALRAAWREDLAAHQSKADEALHTALDERLKVADPPAAGAGAAPAPEPKKSWAERHGW